MHVIISDVFSVRPTVQSDGGRGKRDGEAADWNRWKRILMLVCGNKNRSAELEVAELKMLRFSLGVTSRDGLLLMQLRPALAVGSSQ